MGLAVSGGPDSMALLALAQEMLGDGIEVATVDHGLRPEAAEECAVVARVCAERNIRCRVLTVRVEQGNVQDRARAARYAALGKWARERELAALATAHHADDQAETLLMRLNRGGGLGGLAGIRSSTRIKGCGVPVVRPLLGFRKQELRDLVERLRIPFVEDPSNRDERYDRVRIRRALEEADWIDPVALARSAAHLEEADQALQIVADQVWEDAAVIGDARVAVPVGPTRDTSARLIARAVAILGGEISHGEVAAFLKAANGRSNIAGVLVEQRGNSFICTPEPPRRSG
ncbi:tRNA lysidine(34) synthetase TilS [Qipengyuania sp. SS22]|uniref:tRNA lysidine(34) synthetase TilS n=1 Tax=Qipengyuania sp. SS22 TaxID=2979461 RepID=UPI0021E60459|nr:tRNA lysidine(34) synthetase TilS [Qipengyuania sp. SS22]UYH56313.1 tRNA lysidine(34) synthetase TilS [Qipengyuania sp. SS22]